MEKADSQNEAPSRTGSRMVPESVTKQGSGLLPGRLAEVMVVRHGPADDDVLFPLHRALGELLLRVDDFLEQGIAYGLLGNDLVVEFELLLQDRGRRLVELHLVHGLQRDVVLRVAVNR